jgi:hypothetical protein
MAEKLYSSRPRWHVSVGRGNDGQPGARRNPFLVGLELDAKPVIEHAEGAIAIAHDSFRHHRLYFLRDHPDIRTIAAVVAEAIVAKPVCEAPEKNDIVLEHDIGSSAAASATAATTEAATTTATEAAATATTESATATHAQATATTRAREACTSARGMTLSDSSGANVAKCVAAASPTSRSLRSTFSA